MVVSFPIGTPLGGGEKMTLFLQFAAVLSILFFLYFHAFRENGPRRKRLPRLVPVFRDPERRCVTRSEWKRGEY
jgi:hypothetical protein